HPPALRGDPVPDRDDPAHPAGGRHDLAPAGPPAGRDAAVSAGNGAAEALRLHGVHKSFGKVEVLKGIDLAVAEHEVLCLIGSSGSGKSTLLRCVNLLEPVDGGRVVIQGRDVTGRDTDVNE